MQKSKPNITLYQRAPFIRILLPYVCGICISNSLPISYEAIFIFIIAIFLLCEPILRQNAQQRFRDRKWFGWGVVLFFFAFGIQQYNSSHHAPNLPNRVHFPFITVKIDEITRSDKSLKCQATVVELINSKCQREPFQEKALIYFPIESECEGVKRGAILLLKQQLESIGNRGNPSDFDYASHMSHKGVYLQQMVWKNQWKTIGYKEPINFREISRKWQNNAVEILCKSSISPQNRPILESLLLGYTQHVDEKLRDSFATAGLSHILAVSGLHTGIIAALIYLLLLPLRNTRLRILCPLVTLVLLWIYAFVTGLAPATVRACIMASAWLLGECLGRRSDGLNTLAFAAFAMLLYDPHYLFDVGFQLSFSSVVSLVIFYPHMRRWFKGYPRPLKYICSIIALSLSAQIGALPVCLFYFHTLPFLFVLCNLAIIPLLPFIMGSGFLLLLLLFWGFTGEYLSEILNPLLNFIRGITQFTATHHSALTSEVYISPGHLFFYFFLIIWCYYSLMYRKTKAIIGGLLVICAFLVCDIFLELQRKENYFAVYDRSENISVQITGRNYNILVSSDSILDKTKLLKLHKGIDLKNRSHPIYHVLDSVKTIDNGKVNIRLPYIIESNKRILLLNNNRYNGLQSEIRLRVDYLIIGRKFQGKFEEVIPLFEIQQVIITAEVHPHKAMKIEQLCEKSHLPCHNIRRQGAFLISY